MYSFDLRCVLCFYVDDRMREENSFTMRTQLRRAITSWISGFFLSPNHSFSSSKLKWQVCTFGRVYVWVFNFCLKN